MGVTCSADASMVMLRKNAPRMPAIQPMVMAALRDSDGLKAGTPFEIASIPVRAVQPEENARSTRNQVRGATVSTVGGGSGIKSPWSQRYIPDPTSAAKA